VRAQRLLPTHKALLLLQVGSIKCLSRKCYDRIKLTVKDNKDNRWGRGLCGCCCHFVVRACAAAVRCCSAADPCTASRAQPYLWHSSTSSPGYHQIHPQILAALALSP
jgi:hypothetical protein